MAARFTRLFALVLLVLSLVAGAVPAGASTRSAATGCTISGRVVDGLTGEGIGNVEVTLIKLYTYWDPIGGSGSEWRGFAHPLSSYREYICAYTNSQGYYTIDGRGEMPETPVYPIPAGTYKITFSPSSTKYQGQIYDGLIPGVDDLAAGKSVICSTGQAVVGIDAALSSGNGRLHGTVKSDTGLPVAGAQVSVLRYSPSLAQWVSLTRFSTDSAGRWDTDGYHLWSGRYRVQVRDLGGRYCEQFYPAASSATAGTDLVVTSGSDLVANMTLAPRPVVSGAIVSTEAAPICDAEVTAYRFDDTTGGWEWAGRSYSDERGRYRLAATKAGTLHIEFRDWGGSASPSDDTLMYYPDAATLETAGDVVVSAGATASVDMTMPALPPGKVARVVSSNVYERAVSISRSSHTTGAAGSVVIVNPGSATDLMCAGGLAGTVGGPMLYSSSATLPVSVGPEIKRLGVKKAYLIGSSSALGSGVVTALKQRGVSVVRIAGTDRYDTSARVARQIATLRGSGFSHAAFVVNGSDTGDAAAVSALAYRLKRPVLLVTNGTVPSTVGSAIGVTRIRSALVVGGTTYVGTAVARSLAAKGVYATRVGSTNAYATSAALASYATSKGMASAAKVSLARTTGADAYLAGMWAGRRSGVVLCVSQTAAGSSARGYLAANKSRVVQVRVPSPVSGIDGAVLKEAASLLP